MTRLISGNCLPPGVSRQCRTVSTDGGTLYPTACTFPFTYKGRTFNGCTFFDNYDDQPWCSVTVDHDGQHTLGQGSWGICDMENTLCDVAKCVTVSLPKHAQIRKLKVKGLLKKFSLGYEHT